MTTDFRLPSYRPCSECGVDCNFGSKDEPCWGDVTVVSDFGDEEEIHACEGHVVLNYRKPDDPLDQKAVHSNSEAEVSGGNQIGSGGAARATVCFSGGTPGCGGAGGTGKTSIRLIEKTELIPFRERWICTQSGCLGEMKATGLSHPSYLHRCSKCGAMDHADEEYPRIVYEEKKPEAK